MDNPNSSVLNRRLNFDFALNDTDFSDRVLHIEIIDDSFHSSEGCSNRKRKRDKLDDENYEESSTVVEVKSLHISSPILAANSAFFHKLFKNGMRESNPRNNATLRINASEEADVMEVLNFMYSNALKATTTGDLLGVLITADKFEASDCVRYCIELLQRIPISLESALLYLELPSSVLNYEEVHSLIDAAKKCFLSHYEDINKSREEAMTLSLSAFEVLLGSDSLQADLSEDDIFDFILKWAHAQYPEHDTRREILTRCLEKFVRFRYMSSSKLKEVLVCPDLDREEVNKLMVEAAIMMVEAPYGQNIHASNKCQVIKVEKSEPSQPRCVVYFDLKKEDCENLPQISRLESQSFLLRGRSFSLSAQYCWNERRHSFGLCVCMNKASQCCTLDFEFAAMKKPSMKFQTKGKAMEVKFSHLSMRWGSTDLFKIPWARFIRKDSDYFIDGILHLRVHLTIKDSKP